MNSAADNLLAYLKSISPAFEMSANLQRMIFKNANGTTASPRSLVRRLEEMAVEGKLEVAYENGNAKYRATQHAFKTIKKATLINGKVYLQNVQV